MFAQLNFKVKQMVNLQKLSEREFIPITFVKYWTILQMLLVLSLQCHFIPTTFLK